MIASGPTTERAARRGTDMSAVADRAIGRRDDGRAWLPAVQVGPDGHEIVVSVDAVAGATGVEVAAAELRLGYRELVESIPSVSVSASGSHRIVTLPAQRRLRALTLSGLKHGATALAGEAALASLQRRLAVAVEDPAGAWQPLLSVPPVPARGFVAQSLRGATFANGVLGLPDVQAPKVRISLVSGDAPEDFAAVAFELGAVAAQVVSGPLDLELLGPDGRSLWAFPGELSSGSEDHAVDVRVPLELALAAKARAGEPPRVSLTLRASADCRAGLSLPEPRIAVLREQPGVQTLTLAGEDEAVAFDDPPPAGEVPTAARADLRVRYDGLRVLDAPRDEAGRHAARTAGTVVGPDPVLRMLPPRVFDAYAPARIALVGRAPQACELSVWLAAPGTLAALCAPAVLALEPAGAFALHWFELPALAAPLPAAVVAARATSGRFLWAGETQPQIQIAVRDPDPGGRAVTLGDLELARCTQADVRTPAHPLPAAAFGGQPPLLLRSDLFLTIELGDLRLEYAR